jgi:hypothetical protein
MLILREYDFVWRKPDSRRSDSIAYFEIPQDVDYRLIRGTEFKVIVPAKAVVATDASKNIDASTTTSDVSNATVDGVSSPNTISFKLPHFEVGNYYNVDELVEIVQYTGGTNYTKFTYTSGSPANGQWTYNSSTKTFTIGITDATSVTFYVYYAPKGGQVKVVHKITGAVRTEVSCAVTSTNQHIVYDPGRMPPRIQRDEDLTTRTFLEIHVYPRTINAAAQYEFDPLLPDNSTSAVCLVEMPVERT